MNSRHQTAARPALSLVFASAIMIYVAGCHAKKPEPAKVDSSHSNATATVVPVSVAPVEVRAVQRRVSVVGTLHGFERITITPKVEGRVQITHFDVGDRVSPGKTLLELDSTDYQLAVDEAQQSLNQELARLDLTQPPPADFDIEQLPAVESARLLLKNARQKFERQKTLVNQNASSGQSYEQAETDLKVAEAALRLSRLNARTTLAAVKHRESLLTLARQKMSETQVKAPMLVAASRSSDSGDFVIAKRMASAGEMVRAFPSTPVFELVMDDVLKLHVMVPERYMSQVRMGMDVEVRVEAYPDEVFPGKVARINPTVDPQSRSFDVEAQIPNLDHRLKHGGFAKAEVIVGTADEALTVPLEAVTRFAGVSKVFIVRGETVQEVEIAIGTQGAGWIEALGGLHAGDVVVTSGQSKLANGTRVNVRENFVQKKIPETPRRG
ncbi:MAG: efflux RND transporter periplasmic adaptor subunit [Planctomycetes bacterium]|nr:efflux RND transporter periplasmic adaptor subunit [Planctomycetota bacterium]